MIRARGSQPRWAAAVGAWPVWRLPRWLVVFFGAVFVAAAAAIGVAASVVSLTAHDLILFGMLLASQVGTVELRRRTGEDEGLNKDVFGVWELPIAILLPPVYAMIAPIVRIMLMQWRVRRGVPYRRAFSAASLSLSFGAASVTFHGLAGMLRPLMPATAAWALAWVLLVLVSAVVQSALSKLLFIVAVRGTDPSAEIGTALFQREPLYNDLAEFCIGLLVTYAISRNPYLAPVALPIVALLQRSLRHARLLNASRTDAKTGLLNARTWEREATAEVARAVRVQIPLAVAVLDVDWFKQVNDTYGHLFGDEALKEIAQCLPGVLREYDSAGRFGGEEFVLLLPHTRAVDAFRIADRVRDHISGLSLRTADGQTVQVTVSVGVAALDPGSSRELSELLAAADAALYRAKRDGRNQVQMISTSRGLSAVGGGHGTAGANAFGIVPAMDAAPAMPSAWDVLPPGVPQPVVGIGDDTGEVTAGVLTRPGAYAGRQPRQGQ